MPVTIDEVTAEIATPASGGPAASAQAAPAAADARKHRECTERLLQRAARVKAD
jgi:hypothetical protein